MSENILNGGLDFGDLGEDGLDIGAIFGGGGGADPDPFPAPPAPTPQPAQPVAAPVTQAPAPAPAPVEVSTNLIEAAFAATAPPMAEPAPQQTTLSLFDKPPVFSYGSAKEEISDTSMTFEELRIAKADDFPELAEGKKVSWRVDYGKSSKTVTDPKGTTIASVKEDLEKSKTFLDNLKKTKGETPECLVKPTVTMQSKGIASYKGVFGSVEEAQASDKTICIIPARDGQVYELRKTEMGEFIAPKSNILEFGAVRAGFTPALPLVPKALMEQIITFFRSFMNEDGTFEALAHIYWDRQAEEFAVHIPKQQVSKAFVSADLSAETLPEERYLHYADIHSHNDMEAKFSHVDDADERATRLYLVVGRLDRFYPTITARVSCGGVYQNIDPATVLEGMDQTFPNEWLSNVTRQTDARPPHKPCSSGRVFTDFFVPGVTL
ncbi:MAG: hypothetical protein RR949_03490 [Oscillospiraceae bacterium]